MANIRHRSLQVIAREIRVDWTARGKLFPAARPYLKAMDSLHSLDDKYGLDDARSIVRYFLANVGTWRGPDARRIKLELKNMLGDK